MNSDSKAPLVTIVTVTLNCKKLVEATIRSVESQVYLNKEYIIVDGGSADGTLDIIQKYQGCVTQFISERDKGIYDAMNKGIRLASPESHYIHFLNAGDVYTDEYTIYNMVCGARSPHTTLFGNCSTGHSVAEFPSRLTQFILATNMVCHQACFFQTKTHRRFLYDTHFKICADYKLLLELMQAGEVFEKVNLTVAKLDPGGVSSTQRELLRTEKNQIRKQYPRVYIYAWVKTRLNWLRRHDSKVNPQ